MKTPRSSEFSAPSVKTSLRNLAIAFSLAAPLALAQAPSQGHTPLDQQKEVRRKNFSSGRDLLIQKGIPFDPDELLKDDWPKRLKPLLETMPEMREARLEVKPLSGVYFADTLYLPEVVVLAGDTVIVTNHLVFEGTNPIIKGPHALHVFRSLPSVVLGSTVAELLQGQPHAANVSLNRNLTAPPLSLLLQLTHPKPRTITFDTSAPPRKKAERTIPPLPNRRSVSWPSVSVSFNVMTGLQQNKDGQPGSNGTPGTDGQAGANGTNFGPSANGSCPNSNGQNGFNGGAALPGGNGGDGSDGGASGDGQPITEYIADGDTNTYAYSSQGGAGGIGGYGGNGGLGGLGGVGGDGGNGVTCGCDVGTGGNAGAGGAGSAGGNGGHGGAGGAGGNGGAISVSVPFGDMSRISTNVIGGPGGSGGSGGYGNSGGHGGAAGHGGSAGPTACGNSGLNGFAALAGTDGGTGASGNSGPTGASGNGGSSSITERSSGGGGGVGGCDAGAGGSYCISDGSGGGSPIILDVDNSGYSLTDPNHGVMFDLATTGQPEQLSWTSASCTNAFLALDRNANGRIDNGGELFGNFTRLTDGSQAPNGWVALAELDKQANGGNGDGVIDKNDAMYSRLLLWQDTNHDGVSQPEELHTLASLGVDVIHLDFKQDGKRDRNGNMFRFRAVIDGHDIATGKTWHRFAYDVFLEVSN